MNRYKMSVEELCEEFCRGVDMYDKWLHYPMLAFVTEWTQHRLSEKTIKKRVDVWIAQRHVN